VCGINGFTFRDESLAEKMNELLVHRGPDSGGLFSDDNITLGHRRLKIIDLTERAAQPMSDTEKKVWIVFNGEIYNFRELRKELECRGYEFMSNSDTEIIIYAYKEWGYECVKRFNGMWAFAIYDSDSKKIFLSRDRVGKKPLYYCQRGEHIIFSSEIRPLFVHDIEKTLNKKAVSSYLSYRYVLGEETMFKGIYKLLPAHNMIFDIKKGVTESVWEYWDVEKKSIRIGEVDAINGVERLLKDSISFRQISDVPIGSINSGGLDSSIITAMMASINKKPIRTFTVKFLEKGYDETPFARMLANHCNTPHKEIIVDTGNFLEAMKDYAKNKDEPIGVPNEIALYMLFREIKKSVTVVLSGEGADEIFAGYSRLFRSPYDYRRLKRLEKMDLSVYKRKYNSLYKKYQGRFFKEEVDHFMFLYNYFPDQEKNFILKEEAKKDFRLLFKRCFDTIKGPYEKRISYFFLKLHLPLLLAKLDNSSMRSAVEGRTPFLDYRLVNMVFNLPFKLKTPWKSESDRKEAETKNCDEIAENLDISKYILKRVGESYIPHTIIERKKQGFPLPLQKWFKTDFLKEAKKLLFSEDSKIGMVADMKNLNKWVKKGIESADDNFGQKLWMLVSLELWLREWF